MDSVTLFLLAIAAIFVIGSVGEIIFQRTNIPDVIWLILAGIMLGPVSGLVTRPLLQSIAPYFAALTLVVVLFEGGSALRLSELSRAAPRSTVLALVTFMFSVAAVTLFCMPFAWMGVFPESWTLMHGVLAGVILGGSSSIIIMPAMAAARLNPKLANLVNLESAVTDAFCVVGTAALVDIMIGGVTGTAGPAVTLVKSFAIGAVIGLVAGLVWMLFLRFLKDNEHAYPITLSALLVLYVVIDKLGGSAALGILTVALILGNAGSLSKKIGLAQEVELDTSVRGFHRQMAFIIKSFFFVFIGAMLGPPWELVGLGLLFALVLLGARIPGARLALLGAGFSKPERNVATVSMPRGMAAGVLATLPVAKGVPGTETLPVIVFACVIGTILVFAVGFPLFKSKLEPVAESVGSVPLPAGAARPSGAPPPYESGPTIPAPAAVPVGIPPAAPGQATTSSMAHAATILGVPAPNAAGPAPRAPMPAPTLLAGTPPAAHPPHHVAGAAAGAYPESRTGMPAGQPIAAGYPPPGAGLPYGQGGGDPNRGGGGT